MSKVSLRLAAAALVATAVPVFAANQNASDRAAQTAISHLEMNRGKLQLPAETGFTSRGVFADQLGQTHVHVVQNHDGVKVFGGEAVVHLRGDQVLSVTNDLHRGIGVATRPSISESAAVGIAHDALAPLGRYNGEPKAELVVFQKDNGAHVLAYHVHAELQNSLETRHQDFIIHAHSGRIIDQWNSLETAGSGNSQYNGAVSLDTTAAGGTNQLNDTTRAAAGNKTYNLNHATSGTGTLYTDADNGWGDGANYVEGSSTTAANGQTAAVDAHFGMAKSWDYYKLVHGRNGIDNTGRATYSRVHYSNSYDNAFWSDSCFCMTYGDGSSFLTLTSIDVAGHEMSHGVTATSAGLTYRRESGGLNEANSDIFGTAIEFYSRGGSGGNWTIGEQLATPSFNHPLRWMYNPSLDGRSANCWSKQAGSLDVHYSSGIGNHFFYLLSQGSAGSGGSPTSPTCNSSSVTGIGLAKAEKIWYLALTGYMTSSTNYAGARTATLNAATALYGAGSAERAAVAAAWSAVNVN